MNSRRGSILVVALFVMAVLGLAAVSFAYRTALESRSSRHRVVMARLRAHAASALAVATARLLENNNEFDHLAEPWHTHSPLALEDWLPEWTSDDRGAQAKFETRYSVIDEEGKLHILYASGADLEKLGMSQGQINSLFDWMDEDQTPRVHGAEDEHYMGLTRAHHCKDAAVELLEELLSIRGFDVRGFLGEDANHNRRLDASENDGGLSGVPDNADGQLQLGWVDLLRCVGDGRINLNTAPREVLETLPLSDGAVEQIIGFRSFDEHSSGSLEDHVFGSAKDIEQLQGLTEADREVLAAQCLFRSTHFRVFVSARHLLSGLDYSIQVLVRMGEKGPEILQCQRIPRAL